MSKITVLGVELEYDFFDADLLEKYEAENLHLNEEFSKLDYDSMSNADALRAQCQIVNNFFDHVFGAGTADTLFHGKCNIKDHLIAFSDVVKYSTTRDNELRDIVVKYSTTRDNELRDIMNQYTPNRAQRRFDQKNANRQNGGSGNNPNAYRRNGNKNRSGHRE